MKDSNLKKIIYLIQGSIAWMIYIIMYRKKKKDIWLIGGHLGQIYDDNSKAFFEYMIKEHPDKEVYWVLNRHSLAERQIQYKDKILYRGSIKAFIYCYLSKYIIISHSFADVMPIFYKFKNQFGIKSVHLEHGIYGFKKITSNIDNYYSYFDIICSIGAKEQLIKIKDLNVNEENIKITGLARYDNLNCKYKGNGNIMVMFTWREYEDKSEYINKIINFITNDKLNSILKENNVHMKIVMHSFMHNYYEKIKNFYHDNIEILPKDVNIQQELIKNSLLITDYSSVSWDFAYMGKNVIFYQFDLEQYLEVRGSYLDLNKDLFGPQAKTENEVIELVEAFLKEGIKKDKELRKIKENFKYIDNNNCKRIYSEIIKL